MLMKFGLVTIYSLLLTLQEREKNPFALLQIWARVAAREGMWEVSAEPAADWREVEVRGVLFRAIDTLWIEWASCPGFVAKVLNASGNQIHLHIL